MKHRIAAALFASIGLVIMGCPSPVADAGLTPSTIIFTDAAPSIVIGGAISYTSGSPAIATINAATGAVTPIAIGTTIITATKAATASHSVVSVAYTLTVTPRDYVSTNIGTLKYVPRGTFQRDTNTANLSTVSTFRMSRYEITRAQFLAIMGSDPSDLTHSTSTSDPVQNINWYQAIAFCNKLSLTEGLTPVYSVTGVDFTTLTFAAIPITYNSAWHAATADMTANGYRLPTHMEWVWAAMGADQDARVGAMAGGVNVTGYTKAYSGSTEVGSVSLADANINAYAVSNNNSEPGDTLSSSGTTRPVGGKIPNELGIYDMSGNVNEWCFDKGGDYTMYPAGLLTDYVGMGASYDNARLRHGGSHYDSDMYCQIDYRRFATPNWVYFNNGIRVVRR